MNRIAYHASLYELMKRTKDYADLLDQVGELSYLLSEESLSPEEVVIVQAIQNRLREVCQRWPGVADIFVGATK